MKKIIALSLLSLSSSVMAQPEITAYYLTDTESSEYASLDNLEQFAHTITTNQKTNFNRLVLSFVQPSLQFYKPEMNSLQCTGLFGNFCDSEPEGNTYIEQQLEFSRLQAVISELKNSGIETYIALGGGISVVTLIIMTILQAKQMHVVQLIHNMTVFLTH